MIKRQLHNLFHPKRGEIWMLHRVVEQRSVDPVQNVLEVTPEWLESRIRAHLDMGRRFVAIDDVLSAKNFICITLDDGYIDTAAVALPLFKRLNVPFVVYVTTGFLDGRLDMPWYSGQHVQLSTDMLQQLAEEPLCTIGAHTVSHPHLSTLPADAQQLEIETSVAKLEALTGKPVKHFSYPHGDYNAATKGIVRNLKLRTAVTTNGRTVRDDCDPLELDRINIVQP